MLSYYQDVILENKFLNTYLGTQSVFHLNLFLFYREWKRLVTIILDSRQYLLTTLYHRNNLRYPFDANRVKLKPEQFSIFLCQKMVFKDLCDNKKLINHHLLTVKGKL